LKLKLIGGRVPLKKKENPRGEELRKRKKQYDYRKEKSGVGLEDIIF